MTKPTKKPFKNVLHTDVAIVGGGIAGCALAAILSARGIQTICIDKDSPDITEQRQRDGRTTAISFGSRSVLEAAGVWGDISKEGAPIETIHILDGGRGPLLEFRAEEVGAPAFGWIFENAHLKAALFQRLSSLPAAQHFACCDAVDFSTGAGGAQITLADGGVVHARLVVGADGRKSFLRDALDIPTRGHDYGQSAGVCFITHENPHRNIAIEDFRSEGPFAVLPMRDDDKGRHQSSIVWSQHGRTRIPSDMETLRAALQERLPPFYGKILSVGPLSTYPLSLSHAHRYTAQRIALVADAAHGIHPIAGQGLNLGLRDVAALAELIIAAHESGEDAGSDALLSRYESMRRPDNMLMAGTTDALNALFSNRSSLLSMARRMGLRLVARSSAAKVFFMKQAMGASGLLPSLIRNGTP
jgi:2-octaprenyl-6-methoxyphenol hydroxylase